MYLYTGIHRQDRRAPKPCSKPRCWVCRPTHLNVSYEVPKCPTRTLGFLGLRPPPPRCAQRDVCIARCTAAGWSGGRAACWHCAPVQETTPVAEEMPLLWQSCCSLQTLRPARVPEAAEEAEEVEEPIVIVENAKVTAVDYLREVMSPMGV